MRARRYEWESALEWSAVRRSALTVTTRMLRTLARLTDIGALTTSRTEYSSGPARGSMGSTVPATTAAATMVAAIGIIAVVGIVAGAVTTGFMVTKGSAVEFAEVMNSMAGTASMVEAATTFTAEAATAFTAEARSAAVAAASMVVAAQVMEADTGKSGFFA